jgi:peptidoglycan-associated lipoprotein
MKKKKKHIATLLVLLFIAVVPLGAQTLKTADMYFSGGAYYSAANMYRNMLNLKNKNSEIKAKRGEILFRLGECYRKMNKTEDAKKWYLQAQGAGYYEPDLYYGLGCIQLLDGNYSEAKISFQSAKDKNPSDKRIESKIASCDLYEVYGKANNQYDIKPVENLNTRGSEYGLSFFGDKLIFASTGVNSSKKEISERTGLPYSELYISSPDSRSLYGKVEKLEGMSDVRANEGTFCYDMQTNQLYCTRCEASDRSCYIVKIDIKNGRYKESGKLKLGNQTYGIGHPYITDDGKRVYFTSIMEGGYGGADLWYVDRKDDGEYGVPVNLGANINTPDNEVFPSFIDGVLYFASDGHPGLGGLDLFASYVEDDGNFGKPFNLRAPFNSSWDDFNLVHRPGSNTGLFVSNRNNSESNDDIYTFDNFPPRLIIFTGHVYDKETNQPLKDYTVTVNEGNNKIYEQRVTGDAGYFLYMGNNRKYDIHVTSADYLTSSQLVNTEGIKNFSELDANTYLTSMNEQKQAEEEENMMTEPDSKTKMMIVMKDIFYEFDKFSLTESSKRELDRYLDYFNQYPNMIIEIGAHTDSRGNDVYNWKLSENRAKAVVDYFVSKGVNPNKLTWKGYGKEQLLIPNARTESEHQANRRTVFKILSIGFDAKDVVVRHVSALEMLNSPSRVVDISGWWLQIHESTNYREMELPAIKKAENMTGKEVRLIKSNDGKYRYCIQYSTRNEALQVQLSLLNDNINAILMQF